MECLGNVDPHPTCIRYDQIYLESQFVARKMSWIRVGPPEKMCHSNWVQKQSGYNKLYSMHDDLEMTSTKQLMNLIHVCHVLLLYHWHRQVHEKANKRLFSRCWVIFFAENVPHHVLSQIIWHTTSTSNVAKRSVSPVFACILPQDTHFIAFPFPNEKRPPPPTLIKL